MTLEDKLRQARITVARQKALEYLGPAWILHWTKDRTQRKRKNNVRTMSNDGH